MSGNDDFTYPPNWAGPDRRIELARGQRVIQILWELFGDRVSVDSEQRAWFYLLDEYRAQIEASGMPPQIADSLSELLEDDGGILLAPGDSGFVLLRPGGTGMRFGTTDKDGHRVMDISELNSEEMADALADVDQQRLVEVIVRMVAQRPDLDGAEGLWQVWSGLHSATDLDLADAFRAGIDRGLVTPDELQAAVDRAVID